MKFCSKCIKIVKKNLGEGLLDILALAQLPLCTQDMEKVEKEYDEICLKLDAFKGKVNV